MRVKVSPFQEIFCPKVDFLRLFLALDVRPRFFYAFFLVSQDTWKRISDWIGSIIFVQSLMNYY